jgi:hypothetical protein
MQGPAFKDEIVGPPGIHNGILPVLQRFLHLQAINLSHRECITGIGTEMIVLEALPYL